jgi:hypothetical protein
MGLYAAACVVFMATGLQITLHSWQSTLTSHGIERAYFRSVIGKYERDYLLGMRDTHLGCKTLTYRDPQLAFLGDSHSYAGWDYLGLQERLRSAVIGNCALAGMFPENIEDFVNLVTAAGLSTRYVVFGIQPRMFWDVPERPDRIERARKMMIEVREPRENLPAMATGHWRQIDPFIGTAQTAPGKIDRLADAAKQLDGAVVDRALAASEHDLYALNFWLGYVNEGGPLKQAPEVVHRACQAVRRAGIHLGVVYIPESRWLNQHYTAAQRADFIRNARLFNECADWVDLAAFESMGYDNRDFVNRYLVDNYPYTGWQDLAVARRWISEQDVERRWQFFDPDHMSAAGAREFSAALAPRLSQWITAEGGK